ncbi:MAG: hypothetical protein Kow00107_04370 [Planctomycetota bacterium]
MLRERIDKFPSFRDAILVFRALAVAEGEAHSCDPSEVHFHEVGAWDSIADICAATYLLWTLRCLGVSACYSTPLGTGHGTIECEHGTIPNPAPATLNVIRNFGLQTQKIDTVAELVTPTGAAFIAAMTQPAPQEISGDLVAVSRSTGSVDWPDIESFLEVRLHRAAHSLHRPGIDERIEQASELKPGQSSDRVFLVEANIDDMSGEELASAVQALERAGVLDVWYVQAVGRKGRPLTVVSALCAEENLEKVRNAFFMNTSTIGLRFHEYYRDILGRVSRVVMTSHGPVTVKLSGGESGVAKVEANDVAALADAKGLAFLEMRRLVNAELPELLAGFHGRIV